MSKKNEYKHDELDEIHNLNLENLSINDSDNKNKKNKSIKNKNPIIITNKVNEDNNENIIQKKKLKNKNDDKIETTKSILNKKKLGQFFTTNYEYILQNLSIPKKTKKIIEPFCGNGDLLNFFDKTKYELECYDIEPKHEYIIKRDTLKNPPNYKKAFIITNPPYLSRNKSDNKEIFDKYDVNDLYKCHIKELLSNYPIGGIIIIPLNFFCSIRQMDIDLRKDFLSKFKIIKLNIFEENVFEDTTYTVCSFQYEYNPDSNESIPITIYPSKKNISFELNEENNFTIGGEIYNIEEQNEFKISRLLENQTPNTNILLKAIDDNEKSKIKLEYVNDNEIYYGKISSRTYATLIIEPQIDEKTQNKLVNDFNEYLDKMRTKYNSLFLTNYRESKKIARKRISFDLVYKIVGMLLQKYKLNDKNKKN